MSRGGTLLRRPGDPENSADPDIVDLLARLRVLEYAPAPRPQFRDDLRAQLVAIAPRVVAEGEPVSATATRKASSTSGASTAAAHANVKRLRLGRPLRLVAASVAVLSLGLGGAVWKSQSALPGDSLYGLKRASENVRLSLTSGDTARGHEYLSLASTRVEEAHDLLGNDSAMASGSGVQAGGISPQTAQLVRKTLDAANTDLTTGSALLGTEAVRSKSPAPLQIMKAWAPQQLDRLSQVASEIGAGPLRASAQHSKTLVAGALTRAKTLAPRVADGCVATSTDKFGPSCTTSSTHPAPGLPTSPSSTSTPRGTGTHHTKPGTRHGGNGGNGPTSSTGPTAHPTGPTKSNGSKHHPHATPTPTPTRTPILPTLPPILPSGKPTPPIAVNSCGISVQIGPIGVGIGSCPKSK